MAGQGLSCSFWRSCPCASMGVFFERTVHVHPGAASSPRRSRRRRRSISRMAQVSRTPSRSRSRRTTSTATLAKVVLAGSAGVSVPEGDRCRAGASDDLVDSVRRAIQRASRADGGRPEERGMGIAGHHRRRPPCSSGCSRPPWASSTRSRASRQTGSGGLGAVSAGISEALVGTAVGLFVAIPGGVVLQLSDRADRVLQRRDGQLVVRARRLLHQEGRTSAGLPARRRWVALRESRRAEEAYPCQCK